MDNILRKFGIIRRRDGFTLVELIVVLVIIGILLALAIPNLTGYIDKAQATSCRKNRAELEKIYRYDTLLAKAEGSSTTMSAVLKGENGKKLTCPSGGTYTYNETTEHLMCSISKHNVGNVSTNPIAAGVLKIIKGVKSDTRMDSGAANGNFTPTVIDKLKKAGLSFADMNIESWAYRPTENALYWTSVDISALNPGTGSIPVMKYNEKNKVYTVCTMKAIKYEITFTGHTTPSIYNILDTNNGNNEEVAVSKDMGNSKKSDYNTMNAIYQQALAEYYEKAARE